MSNWEHYDDLPFEVFCVDAKGERHLISRHKLESEAQHHAMTQTRSGGYKGEWQDWRLVSVPIKGSANFPQPVDAVLFSTDERPTQPEIHMTKPREIRCMLCNDMGHPHGCRGCGKNSDDIAQLRAHVALQDSPKVTLEVSGAEFIYLVILCREQVRRLRDMGIEPSESIEMLKRFRTLQPDCLLAQDPALKSTLETYDPSIIPRNKP